MKKFLVILVVLAITGVSAMAFAAEVTVGGSLEVRSRDFSNLQVLPSDVNINSVVAAADAAAYNKANDQRDTQNRIRIDINAKTDNVKAKLELNNDFDTWGQNVEKYSSTGTTMGYREAWVNFNLPGVPVNVNVGHQLLQLGMGTFFRSQHFGSDAWVLANVTGANTAAFVDVKAVENNTYSADDLDAYVLLDVFKVSDKIAVGIDITNVVDRRATLTTPGAFALTRGLTAGTANPYKDVNLQNIGLNLTAGLGAVNLKAQIDYQMGKAKSSGLAITGPGIPAGTIAQDAKFKGNEVVIKGDMNAGAAALNFTLARGTGNKTNDTSPDIKQFVTILDIDPHVAFLYEYKVPTAAVNAVSQTVTDDQLHTGFANTTALNIGGAFDVAKSLNLGAQFWYLRATEKTAIHGAVDPLTGLPADSNDVGMELDVKATWKLYDNLTWTWDLGYFMPGDAYKINDPVTGLLKDADPVTGIQGILAFKF